MILAAKSLNSSYNCLIQLIWDVTIIKLSQNYVKKTSYNFFCFPLYR